MKMGPYESSESDSEGSVVSASAGGAAALPKTYLPAQVPQRPSMHEPAPHQQRPSQHSRASPQAPRLEAAHAEHEIVPSLIGQISIKADFHRRPPAMDRHRSDAELDDLAASIISELDSKHYTESRDASLARDYDAVGTNSPVRFADELLTDELAEDTFDGEAPTSPLGYQHHSYASYNSEFETPQEELSVDDELERSEMFSALLRKMTVDRASPPHQTFSLTTVTPSATSKLAELREKYSKATADNGTVSGTEDDEEGDEGGDRPTSLYDFEHSDEEEDERKAVESAEFSAAAMSEKTARRKDFLKSFNQSLFFRAGADTLALNRAKMDELVLENDELVTRIMAESMQKLVDPAKAVRGAGRKPVGREGTNFALVQDALTMKPSYRSLVSSGLIIDMFKEGCKLSPYLVHCTEDDLLALCQACSLLDLSPKDTGSETLHLRGEAVLSVYVVMHGELKVTIYETEECGFDGPMEETIVKKRLLPGDCLGECVLEGTDRWVVDVAAVREQPASICCIPLDAAQRYIGRKTAESEGVIILFWKHHRLWQEIKQHNQDLLLHAKYQKDLHGSAQRKRENLHFDFSPMNVIESCRIRVFQPGTEVFTQGRSRHYLYIMLAGCSEYRRMFPEHIVESGLMPAFKEIGKPLMCGDFSFMDGEDHLWLDRLEDQDELIAGSDKDTQQIREHKIRKYSRFDKHKNTLVAQTRVEMAVVPIREIAKCIKLFIKLIRLSTERYPDTFTASEELVRSHYEAEKWKVDRKDVIRAIAADKEEKILRESYFHSTQNNISDCLYRTQQPGAKMAQSTLHSIIQHFSNPNKGEGGATDVPPEHVLQRYSPRRMSTTRPSRDQERRESTFESDSNKLIVEMNRPRREALDDYFRQFSTSRSTKGGSRKISTTSTSASLDTWDSSSRRFPAFATGGSRKNSTNANLHPNPRQNSFKAGAGGVSETTKGPRPPLWLPRPSSASTAPPHRAMGSAAAPPPLPVKTKEEVARTRPQSASAVTAPVASAACLPNTAGRRPNSASATGRSAAPPTAGAARPSSAQSYRIRKPSPPHSANTHTAGNSPPRPRSAVSLSASSVLRTDDPLAARPHSTGSSRHLQQQGEDGGDSEPARPKKKNVGFANFTVDDTLAAELNSFLPVDVTRSPPRGTSADALMCSPPTAAASPLRVQSPAALAASPQGNKALPHSPGGQSSTSSPSAYGHRYWRIKDETRKQSNRPVPIVPDKFVEVCLWFYVLLPIFFVTE